MCIDKGKTGQKKIVNAGSGVEGVWKKSNQIFINEELILVSSHEGIS